jgi:alkylhydroperoxidase family enzyme
MTRIDLVPQDITEPADIVYAIRERRRGSLLNLDRVLLTSPGLAAAWNVYLGAIRQELKVPARLRELAICAVAVLNEADYELQQHEPLYLAAGGSPSAVASLKHFTAALSDTANFDDAERIILQLTLEMTRAIHVKDVVWRQLTDLFPDSQRRVEIVAVIATYNMVSRLLVACHVPNE